MQYSNKKVKPVTESSEKAILDQNKINKLSNTSCCSELHSFIEQYRQRHERYQMQADLLQKRSDRLHEQSEQLLTSDYHCSQS